MKYTILSCVYNEEESINELFSRIQKEMDKIAKNDYEILFINDGSQDDSLDLIRKIQKNYKFVRVLSLRKNKGKSAALTVGFSEARGERVITMDADLQDEPKEIPKLIKKMDEGYDLVSGWKRDRKDPFEKKFFSKLFNGSLSYMSGVKLHDFNCGFKLYKKEVVDELNLYGDLYRVIPFLAANNGFKVAEVAVVHNKRKFGKSKYKFINRLPGELDVITSLFISKFGDSPFHFFGIFGGITFLIGLVILVYLFILHLLGQTVGDRPLLLYGGIILLAGLQIILSGLIAELVTRNNAKRDYSILKD